jgi:quercetin dioxygenase-like cupin family protein
MAMKKTLAAISVLSLVALAGVAGSADTAKVAASLLVPAADVKWSDVPDAKGVQIAAVDGDPAKGPAHFLLKFAGGFSAPAHHHSADHFVNVVAGTLVLDVDGKEQKLPAGSYFKFLGMKKHATRCEAGADCVLAMDVRGAWDVVPEASAPPKK